MEQTPEHNHPAYESIGSGSSQYRNISESLGHYTEVSPRRPTVLGIICYGDMPVDKNGVYSVRDFSTFTREIPSSADDSFAPRRVRPFSDCFSFKEGNTAWKTETYASLLMRHCNDQRKARKYANPKMENLWLLEVDPNVYFGNYADAMNVEYKHTNFMFGLRTTVLKRRLIPVGLLVAANRLRVPEYSYRTFDQSTECIPRFSADNRHRKTSERFNVFFYPSPQPWSSHMPRNQFRITITTSRVGELVARLRRLDQQLGNEQLEPVQPPLPADQARALFAMYSSDLELAVAQTSTDDTANNECCICSSNVKDCTLQPCGHSMFCCGCVRELVRRTRGKTPVKCPMCRQSVTSVAIGEASRHVQYEQLPSL